MTTMAAVGPRQSRLLDRLNGAWHKPALLTFTVIVLAHWAEHLAQAVQVYALGWPLPAARGVLGLAFPWLVSSEVMHYGYALIMLAGIWVFREGFKGRARYWWTIALVIQFWHHIEHGILQYQAITGEFFFGRPMPVSLIQLFIPRLELHLIYNTIVFVPMVIGMYYHLFPSPEERAHHTCSCAIHPHPRAV